MTRQITWRCEACGGLLSAKGLYEIGALDRIHRQTCPAMTSTIVLLEEREILVDKAERLLKRWAREDKIVEDIETNGDVL